MTRILFTTPAGSIREAYFTPRTLARLEALGDVVWNELGHDFSEQELAEHLPDIDICLTHWGVPAFTAGVLDQAPRLRLIAHAAGTVADLATPLVFERGIRISSANRIMARYVAEGLLACVLAGLRRLPQQMNMVQTHGWHRQEPNLGSLYEAKIGLIGLGAVGRWFVELLKPFHPEIRVYDPYLKAENLPASPPMRLCGLDELLAWADVISLQASLTPETAGMLNARRLALIRDGALLVNTARGAIIDEPALAAELRAGRFSAVLDVYTREPLPVSSPLRGLDNVLLLPHSAGSSIRLTGMADAMVDEIQRFLEGQPLEYQVSFEQYSRMTRERIFSIYGS